MGIKNSDRETNSTQTAELIKKCDSRGDLEISATDTKDQISDTGQTMDVGNKEETDDEYIRAVLKTYPWYHGMMFGVLVEKLLKYENAYLVRRAIVRSSTKMLCISAKIDDKIFHYQLYSDEQGWSCPKLYEKFPKIQARSYPHIHQMLDAWSQVVNFIVPVPRNKLVLYHESITLGPKLGSGAFGEVFRAKFQAPDSTDPVDCAVKRAIGDAKRAQIQEFCHEARIMAVLGHPNVVGFYGIASLSQPIMLVMELVAGGDLKKYVKSTPNISNRQIVSFALDIARGMKHLSMKKVIHRDLAARNCLITKSLVVKISDFGLSVQGNEVIVKNLKKAPIRWLSPETLVKGVFNERTDVWSYGVVLTELLTRCANDPLYPRDLKEVQSWIKENDHPHRIENVEPKELCELVDGCCEKNPAARINFNTLKRRLGIAIQNYPTQPGTEKEKMQTTPTTPDKKLGMVEVPTPEDRKSGSGSVPPGAPPGQLQVKRSVDTLTKKKMRTVKDKKDKTIKEKKKSGGTLRKNVSSRRKNDKAAKLPPGMN